MYLVYILLPVILFASPNHGASLTPPTPCKADDTNCMMTIGKSVYKQVLTGDKSIGAERLEPMKFDEIDGGLTMLKFKMTDTTISGYEKCDMKDLKHDNAKMSFAMKITCPHLEVIGTYDMDGRLIVLPVQGKGKFSIIMDSYDLSLTVTYKIVKDDGGKEHLSIKTYQAEAEPIKGVKYEFQNLFNGKQDLANSVHKFANENWKEVTLQFQGPIIAATFKKLIKNTNKFLKAMPMDKVFL